MTTLAEIVRFVVYALAAIYTRIARLLLGHDQLLKWSERKFSALLESAPDAMVIVDWHGHIELANAQAERVFGVPRSEMLGQSIGDLIPPRFRGRHRDRQDRCLEEAGDGPVRMVVELHARRSDGSEFPVEISMSPLDTGQRVLVANAIRDITERKHDEKQLQYLADYDALTGVLNRRNFEDHLAGEIAAGRGGTMLLIDIDGLKDVNDTLGHSAGDEVVRTVGTLITERAREGDVVARLGGDEFGVMLHGASEDGGRVFGTDLLERTRDHGMVTGGQRVRLSVSVGVACFSGGSAEDAMLAADLALYKAKEGGRNQIVAYASGDDEIAERKARASWSQRIRTALDEGLLVAYRQPIMSLVNREVTQYELLVRMLDEEGNPVPPGAFLPAAERTGMILEIDRLMVSRAIDLIEESEAGGDPIVYEVNLSARSLVDPDLPGFIAERVKSAGIDPSLLVFEITETAAIANMGQAREFADALRSLGCQFALDDFGAGFASFYYIKHLPLDILKIDGDFIVSLADNPIDQLVVRHLAEIAQALGMKTIAEFVENEPTLDLLAEYDVDYAQGYHIGRPEPVDTAAPATPSPAPLAA